MQLGAKLQSVTADRGIEAGVGKAQVFHVHELESDWETRRCSRVRDLDHPGCEVDADGFPIGRDTLSEAKGQRPRSACQVEDLLSWDRCNPVDQPKTAGMVAVAQQLLLSSPVGLGMAAEDIGEQLLRFHRS